MNVQEPLLGICRSASCLDLRPTPVELYDGPGRYCPNCGELLQHYDPAPISPPPAPPRTSPPARRGRGAVFAAAGAALLLALGVAAVTYAASNRGAGGTIGVCGSSMTMRLARDVVAAYAKREREYPASLRETDCEVTFGIAPSVGGHFARGGQPVNLLGHDALVAIVNPENPLASLTNDQLRGVLAGTIRDWSALGQAPGRIEVFAPFEASDEGRVLVSSVLVGTRPSSTIVRLATSSDVVRAVTAPNGQRRIGLVAFSAAVPGKVLSIAPYPTPSSLTVASGRYPFVLGITVSSTRANDAGSTAFMMYTSSRNGKVLAADDGVAP